MLHDEATLRANHQRFVSRVATTEVVWSLSGPDGVATCPSNADHDLPVLLFFGDRAYAARVRQRHFPDHEPAEISLFDFLFRWLPGMAGDGVLAGTNWNGDLAGEEVEPTTLRDELVAALGPERAQRYTDRLRAATRSRRE